MFAASMSALAEHPPIGNGVHTGPKAIPMISDWGM
jgi:hypothetical protein